MSAPGSPLNATQTAFDTRDGPQPAVALSRGADRALVALHGGHLLSWVPACGGERLYLSPASRFGAGASIRGGIPVIFPQFADRGPLPRHGFARTAPWTFAGIDADDAGLPAATFALDDDDATRALWPHGFALRLQVALAEDALRVSMTLRNTGDTPLAFACALHSYLQIGSLADARLRGLQGLVYRERTAPDALRRDDAASPAFGDEIDRVYAGTRAPRTLDDGAQALRIETAGFDDTVVWNPGPALAAGMGDLAPGGHARFVCVEPACVERAVELAPGEIWRGALAMTACAPAPR